MRILAKTVEGKEFMYSTKSAHRVSERSAHNIKNALNKIRYDLKEGEIWHVYDCDEYSNAYAYAISQTFRIRKGIISVTNCKTI